MPKMTFDEAMYLLSNGETVHRDRVQARALNRRVWVAEWHIPGCLSESWAILTTKDDAVRAALDFAGEVPPRGMAASLRREGQFQHRTDLYGTVVTTVYSNLLRDQLL